MPGRKNPKPSEAERDRDYRMQQKRGSGDTVQGDEATFLDLEEQGEAGEVKRKREEWETEHEKRQIGPGRSRPDDS